MFRGIAVFIVIASGCFSRYDFTVMQDNINTRHIRPPVVGEPLPLDLPMHTARIAVYDCSRIGDTVYIRHEGGDWEKALVADCAGPDVVRRHWMEDMPYSGRRVIAEIDWHTAVRWDATRYNKFGDVSLKVVFYGQYPN
jgi:hypothetical protein